MATRDYKHSGTRRRKKGGSGFPGWAWGITGLAVGLFAAFLVYLDGRDTAPSEARAISAPAPASRDTREVRRQTPEEIPAPPRPRFDFYTMLPELEVVVPEPETVPTRPGEPAPAPKKVEEPGTYMLQAGSFRQFQEADRMKANLALLGIEADIQRVQVNADTWHRVRVGPFSDTSELNRVRERLHSNQIQTLLMRIPEGSG
ncbi:SPOR domain-containing protein [Thioalkalivibrio denitrificans]|uniref:SPOR domain-containing protein n=1 Tax=Thioalkalivibrio denitrificans TaxID=108003 RepID=A0A1V3NGB0_9GAMM|nr:SPOR domain-containing protein [Thioalkalivibrio denitrificans]OOG24147.1 SPOR domain-containing protein [Thioalkalivibrio denitrificans]